MPDVVIVIIDALRADHVGCYAGTDRGTPNMDALAACGVMFRNAVAQAPSTRPSVSSLMTGRYASEHRLADVSGANGTGIRLAGLDPATPTMAALLRDGGLRTGAFVAGNANLKPELGLVRGFEDTHYFPLRGGEDATAALVEWLAAGQREQRRSFGYLHLMDAHSPLPTETQSGRLDGGVDLEATGRSVDEVLGFYAAGVRGADGHVGTLVRALRSAEVLDETLLVVTADHGELLKEEGRILAHGGSVHRKLLHVPLLVSLPNPGLRARAVDRPTQLIDLMPTVLEHAGVPPADVPGRSLMPVLRGEDDGVEHAFSQFLSPGRYGQAVTTATHQYSETYVLDEVTELRAADLRPGHRIHVKGHRRSSGEIVATGMSLEREDDAAKVQGPIEHVDHARGLIRVLGVEVRVADATTMIGREGRELTLESLAAGDTVTIVFSAGERVAHRVKRRGEGGKTKLEGVIHGVRDGDGGHRLLEILASEVVVPADMHLKPLVSRNASKAADPVARVLAGDYVTRRATLHAIGDPESPLDDVIDTRPEIAQKLAAVLDAWAWALSQGHSYAPAPAVDVAPETLDQLQRMGYLD